ncbi:MAG: FecCD family ABC transporter permease [Chloroflexaceae bacterium]
MERVMRSGLIFWFLLPVLGLLMVLHIGIGSVPIAPADLLAALRNAPVEPAHRQIIWEVRLPRALIAVVAGAMLGLAGAILQSVTRNPLAEPGIIGVSAGGVFLGALALALGEGSVAVGRSLPLIIFLGGLAAVGVVYGLSRQGPPDPLRFVLVGLLISAILTSATSVLLIRDQQTLGSMLLWMIGSLNGRVWLHWSILWPWALPAVLLGLISAGSANLLQLGDDVAAGLGMRVERVRLTLISIAALLTAGAVAVVGAIGFIALIGPHIARRLTGEDARRVFPLSAGLTAALLVAADILAQGGLFRVVLPATVRVQIPVGAVTALLGAPFFLYLVRRRMPHA